MHAHLPCRYRNLAEAALYRGGPIAWLRPDQRVAIQARHRPLEVAPANVHAGPPIQGWGQSLASPASAEGNIFAL